ncbi:MAG: DUF6496 domain-containing protein [Candidatus Dependentiae bacterium]
MARYGKKAQTKVEKVMREYKEGTLKSGKSHKPVKSRKQAIAIGLSEARKAGAKVPKKASSRTSKSKTAHSKSAYSKSSYSSAGKKSTSGRSRSHAGRTRSAKSSSRAKRS